ncbi:hypothetical protein ACIGO8_13285 [Streptomyces sp. NPDC053493]|uniref:hypothetical protein n=1 Tax=Streptomyces sp. NPDC053493 TaxID=3365705 RepID=UPI0037D50D86
MAALWALRESCMEMEVFDLKADWLRRLWDVFAGLGDGARARSDRRITQAGASGVGLVGPVVLRAHRPQQPGPHRGREFAIEWT